MGGKFVESKEFREPERGVWIWRAKPLTNDDFRVFTRLGALEFENWRYFETLEFDVVKGGKSGEFKGYFGQSGLFESGTPSLGFVMNMQP
ncbi:hypothetical protein Patl1_08240 [Pistacia atlantica]|uniref:Uncharacterized protein n=1 Tax=Pistacia atlantica TaxID=434234 RepID=A0ACC1AEF4_9ROSI|nr:hypothetical protein Patl1_08240 [Pistacia atlantica]